ncbi:tetratricopeptide repeat protein [Streptomyces anthocyanicus]|uniref:tetratricopeptide repeat protein n=1 Tax=Streptomyces anthocyanicus TaxID=68174 RepID=UPI003F4D5F4D
MVRAAWSGTLGEDHPDTLAAANRLAGCLVGLRKYAEARDLFAGLLPRCERAVGWGDPLTLTVASNLNGCLSALGAHEEARRQCEDIVRRSRLALGPDDPRTLRAASNLAIFLRRLDDHQAALAVWEDTLLRYRRVLGEDHRDTLHAKRDLRCRRAFRSLFDAAEGAPYQGAQPRPRLSPGLASGTTRQRHQEPYRYRIHHVVPASTCSPSDMRHATRSGGSLRADQERRSAWLFAAWRRFAFRCSAAPEITAVKNSDGNTGSRVRSCRSQLVHAALGGVLPGARPWRREASGEGRAGPPLGRDRRRRLDRAGPGQGRGVGRKS